MRPILKIWKRGQNCKLAIIHNSMNHMVKSNLIYKYVAVTNYTRREKTSSWKCHRSTTHWEEESRIRSRHGGHSRRRWRLLSADGSDALGADAARSGHCSDGICSSYRLLSWRSRPRPVQRRTVTPLSFSLDHLFTSYIYIYTIVHCVKILWALFDLWF